MCSTSIILSHPLYCASPQLSCDSFPHLSTKEKDEKIEGCEPSKEANVSKADLREDLSDVMYLFFVILHMDGPNRSRTYMVHFT